MEAALALLIGLLVAAAVYLMLARSFVRFLFGMALISNAVNLLIFAGGRLTPGASPIVPAGALSPAGPVGNPLPQALVLTAIVIGFGLLAFAITLALRAQASLGSLDTDLMRDSGPAAPDLDAETGR